MVVKRKLKSHLRRKIKSRKKTRYKRSLIKAQVKRKSHKRRTKRRNLRGGTEGACAENYSQEVKGLMSHAADSDEDYAGGMNLSLDSYPGPSGVGFDSDSDSDYGTGFDFGANFDQELPGFDSPRTIGSLEGSEAMNRDSGMAGILPGRDGLGGRGIKRSLKRGIKRGIKRGKKLASGSEYPEGGASGAAAAAPAAAATRPRDRKTIKRGKCNRSSSSASEHPSGGVAAAAPATGRGSESHRRRDRGGEGGEDLNWAQCENCAKWRIVPEDESPSPQDRWDCSMQHWIPGSAASLCARPETWSAWTAEEDALLREFVEGNETVYDNGFRRISWEALKSDKKFNNIAGRSVFALRKRYGRLMEAAKGAKPSWARKRSDNDKDRQQKRKDLAHELSELYGAKGWSSVYINSFGDVKAGPLHEVGWRVAGSASLPSLETAISRAKA